MSLTKKTILQRLKKNAPEISKFGVLQIGLFGSYVREEQTNKSDIDIFVSDIYLIDCQCLMKFTSSVF